MEPPVAAPSVPEFPQPVSRPAPTLPRRAEDAFSGMLPTAKPAPRRPPDRRKDAPVILGWVEEARLTRLGHTVKAKLDSGAKTSSVDAEIIRSFRRGDREYVLYRVILDDLTTETFEGRVLRWVRIKDKKGGFIRRPVVRMQFCIGKKRLEGEVNLAERGHFIYPVLIGRNMLRRDILVDPSRSFLSKPQCR
jgi:hypothetical protein